METFKINFCKTGDMLENTELKQFTTWKVGGPARIIYFPFEIDDLHQAINYLLAHNIPYLILGRGSNMLVSDATFEGVVIILTKLRNKIDQQSTHRFIVSSGFGMQQFSRYLAKNNYKGHEFFSGIPGSVGGGIVMNAGTPKGEFKDILVQAQVIDPKGNLKWMSRDELEFTYRSSKLKQQPGYVVVAGDFFFEKETVEEMGTSLEEVKNEKIKRKAKQPLNSPNSGSVFKNPEEGFAGQYVEALGLKKFRIGGAKVSGLHANFIINTGEATAQDIYDLIVHIQQEVKGAYNIELETEVELFNFDKLK